MTAIAQGHNGVAHGNGNHEANGEAQHSVVASTAFSHLTLYTGNTMRTGTTGQLNTTLKKSNQEVTSTLIKLARALEWVEINIFCFFVLFGGD